MAKQIYSLKQISEMAKVLSGQESSAAKGGYKNIPSSGAGTFGWVTWDTVDIRRPGEIQEKPGIPTNTTSW